MLRCLTPKLLVLLHKKLLSATNVAKEPYNKARPNYKRHCQILSYLNQTYNVFSRSHKVYIVGGGRTWSVPAVSHDITLSESY